MFPPRQQYFYAGMHSICIGNSLAYELSHPSFCPIVVRPYSLGAPFLFDSLCSSIMYLYKENTIMPRPVMRRQKSAK